MNFHIIECKKNDTHEIVIKCDFISGSVISLDHKSNIYQCSAIAEGAAIKAAIKDSNKEPNIDCLFLVFVIFTHQPNYCKMICCFSY